MDPASIVGLTAAIQQILTTVYQFGKGVREARDEINHLCSELFALKAALEHVQLNMDTRSPGTCKDAQSILISSNMSTSEFSDMLSSTNSILSSLLTRLDCKPGKIKSALQRVSWPLLKDDVNRDIKRIERLKSFFVLSTTSDNAILCREIYSRVCTVEEHLRQQEKVQKQKQHSELRQSVKTWLSPHDSYQTYERLLNNFQEGTGEWFLTEIIDHWRDRQGAQILWLRAKPGTGKSTLFSAAIRRLQDKHSQLGDRPSLAFFFCSFTDQDSQDPLNVLGSLLMQVCDMHQELWANIEDVYLERKGPSSQTPKRLQLQELERFLVQSIGQVGETLIILDALNESKHAQRIFQSLMRLLQNDVLARLMISSTENVDLEFSPRQAFVIQIEPRKTCKDIDEYVKAWLNEDYNLCSLPRTLKEEIKCTLQRKNGGVFRWVRCQLEALTNQSTPQEIRTALRNVPTTLEQTYREILERIPVHQSQIANRTLFWVAFALKPMKLQELCEAVLLGEDEVVISDNVRLLRKEILLEICGSLISYDKTSAEVTLAHSSVLEFLTSQALRNSHMKFYFLDEETAQKTMTQRCLYYMALPAFNSGYCPINILGQRFAEWPLLTYIATTLFMHLHNVKLDSEIQAALLPFFATHRLPHSGNFGAWVQAFMPVASNDIKNSTPLYYASRFGLADVVKLILKTDGSSDLERRGGRGKSTPLQVASWAGHVEIVKELLKAGANPNETNVQGHSCLMWAIFIGNPEIEKLLRDAGAVDHYS